MYQKFLDVFKPVLILITCYKEWILAEAPDTPDTLMFIMLKETTSCMLALMTVRRTIPQAKPRRVKCVFTDRMF